MRKIWFTDFENANMELFDIVCEDVHMLSEVTELSHEVEHYSLSVNDYTFMQENETHIPQEITFSFVIDKGTTSEQKEKAEAFQKFIRATNKQFVLKISEHGNFDVQNAKMVICKKRNEVVKAIYSTNLDEWTVTFVTQSHFIKIKNKFYEAPTEQPGGPWVYGDNYPVIYGDSAENISLFRVKKIINHGDKKMYIQNTIYSSLENPSWGINTVPESTYRSFIFTDLLPIDMQVFSVTVNAFPPLKKIIKLNVQDGTSENIEDKRDYTKQSYLFVEPGESVDIYIRNIEKGFFVFYEQYVNL